MENINSANPSQQPQISQSSPHFSKEFIVILVLLLTMTVGLGGYILGANQNQVAQNQPQPVPPTTQLSPTPLPSKASATEGVDETANWKTYINTKYGYKVMYPLTWVAKEGSLTSVEFRAPDTKENSAAGIVGITVDERFDEEKEPKEALKKFNALTKTQSETETQTEDTYRLEKEITVGGSLALQTIGGCCLDIGSHVFIFKDKNIYRITLYTDKLPTFSFKNQEIFDQILSTFQFTPLR